MIRRRPWVPPLRLPPPTLTSPTTVTVTQGTKLVDLSSGDYIIQLPAVPLTNTLQIHGHDLARHIKLVGGSIEIPLGYDTTTMLLNDASDYAVYSTRGFTGATGGTFTVRTATATTGPYAGLTTAPIAWNATPATIQTAIETVLGAGSVIVSGPSTTGGPWKFVPKDDRLGRVALTLTGLTGSPAATSPATNMYQTGGGTALTLKQWTGTAHTEGIYIGGAGCDEGINIQNPWDNALAQFANVHAEPMIMPFHNDHHHSDALQAYLGPTELRMHRCDLISHGSQALLGQPRETATPRALDSLRDWWFSDVLFEARATNTYRTATFGPGTPVYMEDDYPSNAQNQGGWQWRMSNCWAVQSDVAGAVVAGTDLEHFNHTPQPLPSGLTLRERPPRGSFCDKARGECGVGYVSPGYSTQTVTTGIKRLQGETKLT